MASSTIASLFLSREGIQARCRLTNQLERVTGCFHFNYIILLLVPLGAYLLPGITFLNISMKKGLSSNV